MVVGKPDIQVKDVEFVSYSGKYPHLCCGVLVLEIEGKKYSFGNYAPGREKTDFPAFWETGGDCSDNGYRTVHEWKIHYEDLPETFRPYVYAIDRVFNRNVPYGCCGGCLNTPQN